MIDIFPSDRQQPVYKPLGGAFPAGRPSAHQSVPEGDPWSAADVFILRAVSGESTLPHLLLLMSKGHRYSSISPLLSILYSQGDLHSYVRIRKRLREAEAKRLFRQMCETVKACHDQGIVLRDLKLRKFIFADEEKWVQDILLIVIGGWWQLVMYNRALRVYLWGLGHPSDIQGRVGFNSGVGSQWMNERVFSPHEMQTERNDRTKDEDNEDGRKWIFAHATV